MNNPTIKINESVYATPVIKVEHSFDVVVDR